MRQFNFNGNKAEIANIRATIELLKDGCFLTRGYVEWPVLNHKFRCMVMAKQSTVTRLLRDGLVIAKDDRLVINPDHKQASFNYM